MTNLTTPQISHGDVDAIRAANFNRVKYLAICFMMLLTAFQAAQNLMGRLYTEMHLEGLSKICFFCLFAGMIGASIFSNHYYKKVSMKLCMILGAVGHVCFLFSGLSVAICNKMTKPEEGQTTIPETPALCTEYALYPFNGLNAMIAGVGIAFIWLAQSRYVNLCADDSSRGKFMGVFWAVSQIAQIVSACLATFVLGSLDALAFYCILTGFGVLAVCMLFFVKDPIPYTDEVVAPESETFGESFRVFKTAAIDRKHVFLFSAILFSGIATSFYATSLGVLTGGVSLSEEQAQAIRDGVIKANPTVIGDALNRLVEEAKKPVVNQYTGYGFIVLAVGEVLAGLSMGGLADKLDKIKLLGATIVVNEIALALTLVGNQAGSYIIMLCTAFFFGFGDTAINTMLGVVIGSKFNARAEMFACLRFFQASGGLITSVVGMGLFKASEPLVYIIVMLVLMVIFQAGFYIFYPKESPSQKSLLDNEGGETAVATPTY